MKITTLKKKFRNEWVLAEVLKEDRYNRVQDVKLVLHAKDRSTIYDALAKMNKKTHVTTIYTGKVPPKGLVYAFHATLHV